MLVLLADQLLSNGERQQEGLLVLCLQQSGHHSFDWAGTEDNLLASRPERRKGEWGDREEGRKGGEGGRIFSVTLQLCVCVLACVCMRACSFTLLQSPLLAAT